MFKFKKVSLLFLLLLLIFLNNCVGSSTVGVFGSGVSVALDPRTLGTQIDDSIKQKNLSLKNHWKSNILEDILNKKL